ncbi:TetR family transcriptional regulator [Actinocorallia sp. API 0066]|uniref:TetR/AcrR family transcriptional regulator n=1 Tax=Actinocorallia sp. API 0066 TaxID=2896846 RepID=UPI001E4984B6|nr:TetR/AcrR family transcriptional regulator [Actinocorallia sp. API 0066]MCD0449748.1 TetR family transcriptional regulator [Actinocorallia sp. API 0066]
MGRPSLAGQRRREILEAAARAVAKHGLAGATQERIALEAGMSRSHVRHYVGNRDELLHALWEHEMTPYLAGTRAATEGREPRAALGALVDFLFGPQMARNDDDLVIENLISGAMHDVRLRGRIYETYRGLERDIAAAVRAAVPGCDAAESRQLAYSLICMAFGHSMLAGLPFPASRQAGMKELARQLTDALAARTPDPERPDTDV